MNRHRLSARLAVLVSAGVAAIFAADSARTPRADADNHAAPIYNVQRSFARPVGENPVGQKRPTARAFLGAPPPMPHSFAEERDGGRACLECHARETRIEKRQEAIAPVPHAEFSQCQQCHVNGSRASAAAFRDNTFVGLDEPGKGSRAFAGAPPTVSHKIFMREYCLACHSPAGKQRIATPHASRSQCQQCHVTDASKDCTRPVRWTELDGEL